MINFAQNNLLDVGYNDFDKRNIKIIQNPLKQYFFLQLCDAMQNKYGQLCSE